MRLIGYCKVCHKIKYVSVRGADLAAFGMSSSGLAQGTCDDCEKKEATR